MVFVRLNDVQKYVWCLRYVENGSSYKGFLRFFFTRKKNYFSKRCHFLSSIISKTATYVFSHIFIYYRKKRNLFFHSRLKTSALFNIITLKNLWIVSYYIFNKVAVVNFIPCIPFRVFTYGPPIYQFLVSKFTFSISLIRYSASSSHIAPLVVYTSHSLPRFYPIRLVMKVWKKLFLIKKNIHIYIKIGRALYATHINAIFFFSIKSVIFYIQLPVSQRKMYEMIWNF